MGHSKFSLMFLETRLTQVTAASNTHKGDLLHAVILGLDADGGQAGDSDVHSEECTSGDQKPRHPRVSAGKAFPALGLPGCGCRLTRNLITSSGGPKVGRGAR